jgi:copper(I)-binding protein
MTAAYLTLSNSSARPERLLGVRCDCAAEVSAHQTLSEGGVMRMRSAGEVVVPAHGSVAFTPGALHLMVMGLKRAIKSGDTVAMTLTFDHAGPVKVKFKAGR